MQGENSSGLRSLLKNPVVYSVFQSLIVRRQIWPDLFAEFIGQDHGKLDVLDIGCGPGSLLKIKGSSFDPARFVGVDLSVEYINRARLDFPSARFECGTVSELGVLPERFDLVVMSGVLHHVNDVEASEMMKFAVTHVRESGIVLSVDPVIFPGQHRFARFMAEADRGQYIRSVSSLAAMWENTPLTGNVSTFVKSGYLRVPYNHGVCVVRKTLIRLP